MYVFFYSGIAQEVIKVASYEIIYKLIVQGHPPFVNSSIIENPHDITINDKGDVTEKTSYRIEVNGLDLPYILSQKEVDQSRTFSNDIFEMRAIFGIEEAHALLLDELMYDASLSDSLSDILSRHHAVYADVITHQGQFIFNTRHSLRDNAKADPLAKMSFEETKSFARQAVREGKITPIHSYISKTLYGQMPHGGSGYSEVLVETAALGSERKAEVATGIDKLIEGVKLKKPTKKVGGFRSSIGLEVVRAEDMLEEA